jgi:hypothetical protein
MSFADDFDAAGTEAIPQLVVTAQRPAQSFAEAFDASPAETKAKVLDALPKSEDSGLLHQLGLTARAGITGLTSLPNMVGDATNSAINLATSGINKLTGADISKMALPSEVTQQLLDRAGVSKPQNSLETGVQGIASAMAGVSPSVLLGKALAGTGSSLAQSIGAGLQQAPGMQIMGAGGSGAGAGIAAQMGGGIGSQLAGGLLGGMAGVTGASGITSALRRATAPSQQEMMAQALKMQASNAAEKPRIKLNVDGSQTAVEPATSLPEQFSPPAVSPSATPLSSERQLENIQTMRDLGLNEQRQSAISGNKFDAGIEYENAKLNNAIGQTTRDQLSNEQNALKSFGQNIISDTGTTAKSPEQVGQSIKAPMQALSDHYDNQIKSVYDEADSRAAGAPIVRLNSLGDMLNTNSIFAGKAENSTLRRGVRAYMKEQDITANGGMQPIDVQTAEGLRKYLNSQWSPQNSGLIGKIKESLDNDVSASAGEDIYQQARAIHAERKNTLDNPNGISKLLQEDGPNGINQAVPDERVGAKLLGMPTGQFSHIVDTIKALPDEIKPQGQQALNEIRGAMAKRIYDAGDSGGTQNGPSNWNASNVTKALNEQKSKMEMIFTPDELQKFRTLHDAGHILQTPSAYKGAAAQGYNFLQSGVLTGLPAAGAGIGAMLGGPAGSMIGSGLGGGASLIAKKGLDASMAAKLAEKLRNPMPQFPK